MRSIAPWLAGALALGGVAAAMSRRRDLMIRWCAWAVGVPLVTAAFWVGSPGTAALAIVVGSIAAVEFGALMQLHWPDRVVLVVGITAMVLAAWLAPEQLLRVLGIALLAVAAVPLLTGDATNGLRRLTTGVLGLCWLSLLAALVPLATSAFVLFVAVSVSDIVAYFAGPRLGGPRLSPLSPGKRWSGTLAGSVAGLGILAALSAMTWPMVAAVAVGAPLGDLLESMIKRGVQSKDSGTWLAGQGGLLDRIDSLLLALAVLAILT